MSMSAPQKAVMWTLADLEQAAGEGAVLTLEEIQLHAKGRYGGGEKITAATLNGLCTSCKVSRNGRYFGLAASGRDRLRDGL